MATPHGHAPVTSATGRAREAVRTELCPIGEEETRLCSPLIGIIWSVTPGVFYRIPTLKKLTDPLEESE